MAFQTENGLPSGDTVAKEGCEHPESYGNLEAGAFNNPLGSTGAQRGGSVMSKNALKRLLGQKRLQETKDRRKAQRAEAKRRKKKARRDAATNGAGEQAHSPPKDAGLSVRVCIDCDFEDLQTESEIFSLVQQLMYAYGDANRLNRLRDKANGTQRRWKSGWRGKSQTEKDDQSVASTSASASVTRGFCANHDDTDSQSTSFPMNRAEGSECGATHPDVKGTTEEITACFRSSSQEPIPAVDFCITGVGPRITDALKRVQCNGRWKCEVCNVPFEQKFAQQCAAGRAVYLTADAEEELETLHPDTVYIVGGIVDRNRYKGLSLKRSTERGVRAAKLPIASKLGRKLEGSKILTVNQVVSVLIAYAELGNWNKALNRVLPPRKVVADGVETKDCHLEENILLSA